MGLSDGLQHLGYSTRLSLSNNVSRRAIDPSLVFDASCFVTEPSPPQNHYPLAVALSTFAGRRWMAALSVHHWIHRFPRLVVSDWDDEDTSGLVGMRWGTGFTWRGIAPVLCLADALCGRFDWVLFCDDDTAIDVPALSALLAAQLAAADAALPHFLSFAPQPFPLRVDWQPTMRGCLNWLPNASATTPPCRKHKCRAPPDLSRACTGAAEPLTSAKNNLHAMWPCAARHPYPLTAAAAPPSPLCPFTTSTSTSHHHLLPPSRYGGLGFLLSRGAAAALQEGGAPARSEAAGPLRHDANDATGGGAAADSIALAHPALEGTRAALPAAGRKLARGRRSCRHPPPAAEVAAQRGQARGRMNGHANLRARRLRPAVPRTSGEDPPRAATARTRSAARPLARWPLPLPGSACALACRPARCGREAPPPPAPARPLHRHIYVPARAHVPVGAVPQLPVAAAALQPHAAAGRRATPRRRPCRAPAPPRPARGPLASPSSLCTRAQPPTRWRPWPRRVPRACGRLHASGGAAFLLTAARPHRGLRGGARAGAVTGPTAADDPAGIGPPLGVRPGFCASKHTKQLSADCRSCGGPDVQVRRSPPVVTPALNAR